MDPYQSPDSQSEAALDAMITRLEDRGQNADFMAMIDDYLADIPRDQPLTALDLGCGTGVVTRVLRRHLSADSQVHGADISERFLAEARERSAKDTPDGDIQWDPIASDRLPYPDQSMDLVLLHTLMSHVPDPVATLEEVKRVLKPSGQAIVFDADYASTTYGYPDFKTMREIDHKLLAAVAANLGVCRQMPRYLKEAGLQLQRHQSYVLSEAGRGDFWLSSVQGFAKLIPALKILPEEQGDQWITHMLQSHEDGTFFAASNYYTFVARAL